MEDDEQKKKPASYTIGQDHSLLSVEEVNEVIDVLREEILRLEESRASKTAHLSAAEALSKS